MRISVTLTALPATAAFGSTWAQVDNWRFTQLVPPNAGSVIVNDGNSRRPCRATGCWP